MRPLVTTARPFRGRGATRRGFLAAAGAGTIVLAMGPERAAAKPAIMTPPEAHAAAKAGEIVLVDIRRPEEWAETGIAEGAVALDMTARDFVQRLVDIRMKFPKKPIAMICRTGNRSNYVTTALDRQGFPGLADVSEGMAGGRNGPGWLKRGLPVYAGTPENVKARLDALFAGGGEQEQDGQ